MAAWAVGVALTPTLSQRERGSFDTAWKAGIQAGWGRGSTPPHPSGTPGFPLSRE